MAPLLGESHPLNQSNSLFGVAFYSILLLFSMFNFRFLATIQVILHPKDIMSCVVFPHIYVLVSCDTNAAPQMILSASAIGVSCYLAYILHFILQVISAVHHDGFKPVIINVFNFRIFV